MGSFNLKCAVSNLEITENDEVVLVLLHSQTKNKELNFMKSMVYANSEFQPCYLPIFGKYDGYGSIKLPKIDESALEFNYVDEMIQNMFDIGLDEFLNLVQFCNSKQYISDLKEFKEEHKLTQLDTNFILVLNDIRLMFIRKDVYDVILNYMRTNTIQLNVGFDTDNTVQVSLEKDFSENHIEQELIKLTKYMDIMIFNPEKRFLLDTPEFGNQNKYFFSYLETANYKYFNTNALHSIMKELLAEEVGNFKELIQDTFLFYSYLVEINDKLLLPNKLYSNSFEQNELLNLSFSLLDNKKQLKNTLEYGDSGI